MATIALYANKINQMPGLIKDVKQSVVNYKSELSSLKTKALNINKSVCNLDDVISSIQSSSQTQEKKITSLETFSNKSEEFISEAIRIDGEAATVINERKDDFYKQYDYLKPECEKSGWEKFCDTCQSVVDWCRDNWQSIGKILIAVVIVVGLGIAAALTGGVLAVILGAAFWGALSGGLIGGVMGGVMSVMNGGSFLEGFADGALSGVISGAITGAACAGLGALGAAVGKSIKCISTLGKAIKVTSKVSAALSLGMDAFDLLALGISFFDPTNPLVTFNQQLHSSVLYNGFQIFVNALAVFTAGATSTMKCFVAGTMILTSVGFIAIENIKVGDKVISTNPETLEVAEKTVLETYIRETRELLHLTINGELFKTTFEHPFYVKDVGFVEAGKLQVGDKLLDSKGNILIVDDKKLEITDGPVKVYNFQVDDFHTYHVGENGVLVHNADYSDLKLTHAKSHERKIDSSKNFFHDQGDFGEEVMKKLAKENNLGTDISAKFQHGRNGIDGAFLSEGPPPKLTIIESKASRKGEFSYTSYQKQGGEKYFESMRKRTGKAYKKMQKEYINLTESYPNLEFEYIRVETKVKITKKGFGVESINVKAWGEILN